MKKKNLFIGIAVIVILAFIKSINFSSGCNSALTLNWGVSIPAKYEEVYEKDSGISFHGDGIRYHILHCDDIDKINEWLKWTHEDNATIFSNSYISTSKELLTQIDILQEYDIPYENCVFYYDKQEDNSEIIMFWNPTVGMLYIVEQFL